MVQKSCKIIFGQNLIDFDLSGDKNFITVIMNGIIETINDALQDLLGSMIKSLPNLLTAIIILFLTKYLVKFITRITDQAIKRTIKSDSLKILFKKTIKIGIWSGGALMACVIVFPEFSLGDIIASLGLGSVAIGFAFQDIFKNFLAGILLLAEEPFHIGDEIAVNDYQGLVENISVRTTQIRTYRGEKVLIPNSIVFTDSVQVITAYQFSRTDLSVGVDYNTSLPEASRILEITIINVEGVLEEPKPEIDLVNFGDSSIDFVVRYWTFPQRKNIRQVQTKAILAIKKALDEAQINIPYPIRTLYYYNQEKYNDYLPRQ
ncbi:MAG: mechanosensitive ion channel family protein [Xenococcus sp. MO_188.B8]|nr:mechanosensitive ion channel family protein [Xenococcus sp. MO_188.B8]